MVSTTTGNQVASGVQQQVGVLTKVGNPECVARGVTRRGAAPHPVHEVVAGGGEVGERQPGHVIPVGVADVAAVEHHAERESHV